LIEKLNDQLKEHEDYRAALAEQEIKNKLAAEHGAATES